MDNSLLAVRDINHKYIVVVWNVGRGALAAVLDLVKTALAIQDLKNTLDTLPLAVVAEVMGIEVPGLSLEKVDDLKNMAYGAVAALQEPPRVLAALGQKIGDTVEEEGIAYSISYVAADVAIQVLLSKGLGEVKNVSKADDLVDVARTVDTLDDTVKIADELTDAAKAVDKVGDIKDATMAMNVMDETKAAVKAVDKVDEVAVGLEHGSYSGEEWCRYLREVYGEKNVNWENATASQLARSWQGQGKYIGVDEYIDVTIKKGEILYRGEPNGTEYFTTLDAIEQSGREATKLFEGLQVEKHPIHGYRGEMQGYIFNDNVVSAYGITNANPQFGEGGLPQYYVPNIEDMINKNIVSPVESIKLNK